MGTIASQITSLTTVYSTVYSDADQWKHQTSASLAFVRGIHQWIPAQMASNAENVSIWWRHHDVRDIYCILSNNALDIMDVCTNYAELTDCETRLSNLHVTHWTVIIWQEQDLSHALIVNSILMLNIQLYIWYIQSHKIWLYTYIERGTERKLSCNLYACL